MEAWVCIGRGWGVACEKGVVSEGGVACERVNEPTWGGLYEISGLLDWMDGSCTGIYI